MCKGHSECEGAFFFAVVIVKSKLTLRWCFIVDILNYKPHYMIVRPHPAESISLLRNSCVIPSIIHVHLSCSRFVQTSEFMSRLLHCILNVSSIPRCISRNTWSTRRKSDESLVRKTEDIVSKIRILEEIDQIIERANGFEGKRRYIQSRDLSSIFRAPIIGDILLSTLLTISFDL